MTQGDSEIIIYQTEGGHAKINVQMEGELIEDSVAKEYLTTAGGGKVYQELVFNDYAR